MRVAASLDTVLTYTDSRGISGQDAGGDFITELRPNLLVTSRSGRVRGSLNYALGLIHHSRRQSSDTANVQNTLGASFTAEAIENRLYIDGQASVARTAISAYGQQFVEGSVQTNANRSEVGTVSVSPYLRGQLASIATYEVRLNAAATNTRDSIVGDSDSSGGSVSLSSAKGGSVFGWSLLASHNRSHFRVGGSTAGDRAILSATARPDPEVVITLRGGQEANDVIGNDRTRYNNYGGGVRWTPSERTTASADADERYFGRSFRVAFQHRFARSSFSFTSSRDASGSADPNGVGRPLTLYQLYFNQFASLQPDPALRDQLVLDFLRSLGQDPNATVGGGFVNSGVTLQRREDLSYTYTGLRAGFTLQAFAVDSRLLDNPSQQPDDGAVRQRGFTATVNYRLTPTATAGLTASQLKTLSTASQNGNELNALSLTWADQLGKRTSANLSARYSVFHSATAPYRESSLIGSFSLRF